LRPSELRCEAIKQAETTPASLYVLIPYTPGVYTDDVHAGEESPVEVPAVFSDQR